MSKSSPNWPLKLEEQSIREMAETKCTDSMLFKRLIASAWRSGLGATDFVALAMISEVLIGRERKLTVSDKKQSR